MSGLITFISGPPGAGKTTLAGAMALQSNRFMHIPVDDLRLWVKSGLADSVPWSEEAERQFQIAESAACAVARTYADRGFDVVVDHCRNPRRLDEVILLELQTYDVRRVLLLPDLETNLARNRQRSDKPFDPSVLEETIRATNRAYRESVPEAWIVIDNSGMSPEETMQLAISGAKPCQSR